MMKLARRAARRSLIGACLVVVLAMLAGTTHGLAASAPPSTVRVTFVSHAWADEDRTLSEDAAWGLQRFRGIAGCRMMLRWISLRQTRPNEPARTSVYAAAADAVRDAAGSSDFVIAWGDVFTGPVLAIAREYPRIRFGLVSPVDVDRIGLERVPLNVVEGSFRDEEEAFLAGAAAAMASQSLRVGYIGPQELTPRRIGFEAGVFYANPNVRVIVDNVGFSATLNWDKGRIASWTLEGAFEPSLHNIRKAEEVALAQYARGVDVTYVHAGGSDAGVYEAAAIRHRWVIGSGGPRTEGTLPARWRNQILAVISEHAERAAFDLAARLLQRQPLPRHVVWGLTYPGAPVIMIDYTTRKPQFDRFRPYTLALMKEIGLRRIKVPYSQPQLANFMKVFPR